MATTTDTTNVAEELAQAERELAALAQAIARLYDQPVLEAAARLAQQRQREELDARLDAVRLRVLTLRLAHITEAYTAVAAALQHEQAQVTAAETALRQAQYRLTTAGARMAQLEVQERVLREQRARLRQQLVACELGDTTGGDGRHRRGSYPSGGGRDQCS